MKKFVLTLCLSICIISLYSQPRTIGLRFGYDNGITYQHTVGGKNAVTIDAGYVAFNGIQATVTHDWMFPITSWTKAGAWNWFAGVGAGVSYMDYRDALSAGIAGRLGVEYNFEIPLQLAFDWRPVLGPTFFMEEKFVGYSGAEMAGFAFAVRYRF